MKRKLLLMLKLMGISLYIQSQNIIIQPGTTFYTSGNVSFTLMNMGINSSSTADFAGSNVYLKGNTNTTITTSGNFFFQNLFVDKPNAKVLLGSTVSIGTSVNMINGQVDLNTKNIILSSTAVLSGETDINRITGANGGEIIIAVNLNAPNQVNPGNLGALITSTANLGSVTIRRGHKMQTGSSLAASINRYYDIQPANNTNLDAKLRFYYLNSELNGQNENILSFFKSTDNGITWTTQTVTGHDTAANYYEKTGIGSLNRWTLSGASASPLPVTGLQFTAKRIANDKIQLNWKTIQEINNAGFYIERKKETDNDFISRGFVTSLAPGGNSGFPLDYARIDTNGYGGKTYYRIKQQDIDGRFTYSVIRLVNGTVSNTITLKAWPIPASGDFYVNVEGTAKDIVQIFDATGKLVQQLPVTENNTQKVKRLPAGVYFLGLANQKDIRQQVVVQ